MKQKGNVTKIVTVNRFANFVDVIGLIELEK